MIYMSAAAGITVTASVCDGAATNRRFVKICTFISTHPYTSSTILESITSAPLKSRSAACDSGRNIS